MDNVIYVNLEYRYGLILNSGHNMILQELIRSILARCALPREGIHGLRHWARVLENGRRLSEMTKANSNVVELFAVFHDSQRVNDGIDDGHGMPKGRP